MYKHDERTTPWEKVGVAFPNAIASRISPLLIIFRISLRLKFYHTFLQNNNKQCHTLFETTFRPIQYIPLFRFWWWKKICVCQICKLTPSWSNASLVWCSRDKNVQTETWLKFRDGDFIKKSETETRDSKIFGFSEGFQNVFQKISPPVRSWNLFEFLAFFNLVWFFFLSAYAEEKDMFKCRNFTKQCRCSIQSLKVIRLWSSPVAFETETSSEPSRPRPEKRVSRQYTTVVYAVLLIIRCG